MNKTCMLAFVLCTVYLSTPYASSLTIATKDTEQTTTSQSSQTQKPIPASAIYRLMAAEMALNRSDHETAMQNYILASQETQDPAIAERATQIALTVSSLENALEPALIWATSAPKSLEANLTVAAIFIRLQSHHKAAHYLTKVEALDPEQAYYHFLMVYRQLQGTNGKDVVDALTYLIEAQPSQGSILALAEIELALEQFQKAFDLATRALDMKPTRAEGIRIKTESLRQLKGQEEAAAFLQKQVAAYPENNDLSLYNIEFLLNTQQYDLARQYIERFIETNLTPDQSLTIARMAMQAQWYDLAEKGLLKTLQSEEHQNTAHYLLARIAELQDKPQEAINWYQQVLAGPFHVISQIKASQLLTDDGLYDQAIGVLRNTQPQNDFDNKRLVLTLVDVYGQQKQYARGLEVLDKVLKLQPEDTDFLYAHAISAEKLNQFPVAEKDLAQILIQDPYHVEALNALGYMLTVHTQRYDEALSYLKRALELSPNNASVLDSIGWLYYKMGNLNEALAHLRQAAKIMPDPEIAAHLGEVLWKLNNKAEAKTVWQSALEAHPNDKLLTEVMKRLVTD